MIFNRPSLEDRIAARQREMRPSKAGKYFEHRAAAVLFFVSVAFVVVMHIVAFIMIKIVPG